MSYVSIPAGSGGGGGAVVSSATPQPNGTAAPGISADASRADHVHTDNAIERQTLGAAATSITFALDGDTDEMVEITGEGPMDGTVGSVLSAEINSVALGVGEYSNNQQFNTTWSASASNIVVVQADAVDNTHFSFCILLSLIRGAANTVAGNFLIWSIRPDTSIVQFSVGTLGKVVAANVTAFKLVTTGRKFKIGYKTIVRRMKVSA